MRHRSSMLHLIVEQIGVTTYSYDKHNEQPRCSNIQISIYKITDGERERPEQKKSLPGKNGHNDDYHKLQN